MRVGEFKFRAGGQKYWLKDGTLSGEPIEGVEPTEISAHVVFIWRDEQNRRVTTYVMEPCNSPGNPELAQQLVEQANQLSRLTALLEDRTKLAEELMKHGLVGLQEVMAAAMSGDAQSYGNTRNTPGLAYQLTKQSALALADRLIAYLKPLG